MTIKEMKKRIKTLSANLVFTDLAELDAIHSVAVSEQAGFVRAHSKDEITTEDYRKGVRPYTAIIHSITVAKRKFWDNYRPYQRHVAAV